MLAPSQTASANATVADRATQQSLFFRQQPREQAAERRQLPRSFFATMLDVAQIAPGEHRVRVSTLCQLFKNHIARKRIIISKRTYHIITRAYTQWEKTRVRHPISCTQPPVEILSVSLRVSPRSSSPSMASSQDLFVAAAEQQHRAPCGTERGASGLRGAPSAARAASFFSSATDATGCRAAGQIERPLPAHATPLCTRAPARRTPHSLRRIELGCPMAPLVRACEHR